MLCEFCPGGNESCWRFGSQLHFGSRDAAFPGAPCWLRTVTRAATLPTFVAPVTGKVAAIDGGGKAPPAAGARLQPDGSGCTAAERFGRGTRGRKRQSRALPAPSRLAAPWPRPWWVRAGPGTAGKRGLGRGERGVPASGGVACDRAGVGAREAAGSAPAPWGTARAGRQRLSAGRGRGSLPPPRGSPGHGGGRVLRPQHPCAGASGQRGAQGGRVCWKTAWSCRQSLRVDFRLLGWFISVMAFLLKARKEGFWVRSEVVGRWNPKELWPSPSSEMSKRGRRQDRGRRAARCSLEGGSAFGVSSALEGIRTKWPPEVYSSLNCSQRLKLFVGHGYKNSPKPTELISY